MIDRALLSLVFSKLDDYSKWIDDAFIEWPSEKKERKKND